MSDEEPVESGLQDMRIEWVPESTPGTPPTDPAWNAFSREMDELSASIDGSKEAASSLGYRDFIEMYRGPEESELTIGYKQYRFPATTVLEDPDSSPVLGVKSTDSSDTDIDVTIYNDSESQQETITTDGTDATTFTAGSKSFDSIGRVVLSTSATGDIEISTDNGGSAGTLLGTVAGGTTDQEDTEIVDPIAYPIAFDNNSDYPSLTVVSRREVSSGGADGAGYREYLVALGARPTASSMDGDPSAAEAMPQELTLPAKTIRPHIIHQPAASGTLVVESTDTSDAIDVVLEDEDAGTTETVTLPGTTPNEVATTGDFANLDAVWAKSEHAGDIQVGTNDGGGSIDTELLQKPLTGYNTDGVDSVEGIPPLGGGSHASAVTDDGRVFLGTQAEWANAALGEKVNTLDLSVELDTSREAIQTSRRQAIDVGMRTVEFDADLSGPYETAEKIKAHFRDKSGDLVYGFDDDPTTDPSSATKKIVAHNAEIVDAPDYTRTAGDTNYIPSVTFRAIGDPAIEIINTS